ncbi:hypothetical protein GCM10028820_02420 [Tessaracoccus terricola]
MKAPNRWSPWWAIALTCVALLVPVGILGVGLQQLSVGMSGAYMSELSLAIAPVVIAIGVFLLVPGVLYLVVRQKLLFVATMVVTAGVLAVPALTYAF